MGKVNRDETKLQCATREVRKQSAPLLLGLALMTPTSRCPTHNVTRPGAPGV